MSDSLPTPPPSASAQSAPPPPPPAPVAATVAVPKARQIVSINDEGTNFELDEKALREIFDKVPEDMKVAIVSVVGAFRTGKSFVLDLFLRYLRFGSESRLLNLTAASNEQEWKKWLYANVDNHDEGKLEGNSNMEQTHGEKGFSWRAGRKRNTTGIWMWETPFIRKSQTGEDIAVFLIDTQGMFDSETSQMLTASIFGLSTLLSSYQIYNVDKRVQEDNLQHLALFTEYGRMALFGGGGTDNSTFNMPAPTIAALKKQASSSLSSSSKRSLDKASSSVSTKSDDAHTDGEDDDDDESSLPRPFQRLDFLVRDWQDFSRNQTLAEKRDDMKQYMKELLSSRKQKDLADTREQIHSCFERVDCFLLPHPGYAVTEREYDGAVSAIDDRFLELLTAYLDDVFDAKHLFPKKIHGMPVSSRELFTYIKAYAALFREATIFPEAKTLLEATAEANNVNMKDKALAMYKKEMEKIVGPKCVYVPVQELQKHHELCFEGAMTVFDAGAKMGRRSQIMIYRERLVDHIEAEHKRYVDVNAERDPYKNLEFYLVPGVLAFGLLIFRVAQDIFCYESIGYDIPLYDCKHVSHTLSHLYWAIIFFMLLIMFSTGQVMVKRVKTVLTLLKTVVQESGDKEKKD
ncbi:hypothetical protein ATCC90586_008020 [Pythium insidiosum]|nr:hypothetical protein ATCC90586_008020 [Pythium insidiosum]